jgi:hypothetical protein
MKHKISFILIHYEENDIVENIVQNPFINTLSFSRLERLLKINFRVSETLGNILQG